MIIYDNYNFEQGSEAWHALRLGVVTASNFNTRMGSEKYMLEKIYERLYNKPYRENYTNDTMQRGLEMEPYARAEYQERTGIDVYQVGFVKHNDNIGCSPDGLSDGGLEIKCPHTATHMGYILSGFPATYKAQVQGGMWVCERDWWDFVSFDDRHEMRPYFCERVYRDEKYIKQISVAVYDFVDRMLELEAKLKGKNLLTQQLEQSISEVTK